MKNNSSEEFYLGDSMHMYLAKIGKLSLLTAVQEIELGKIINEGG